MKYFLYTRKSEEDKNRQVQSIETQTKELRQRFPDLTIVDEFEEARTAKQPGRPLFNEMVRRIQGGEAQGILVWSINRLLRNPVDQGNDSMVAPTAATAVHSNDGKGAYTRGQCADSRMWSQASPTSLL